MDILYVLPDVLMSFYSQYIFSRTKNLSVAFVHLYILLKMA